MNQILVTGEENVIGDVTKNVKKQKSVLPINGIVIFYAISIIILGICMISGSVYAKGKINEAVEASIKPEITVEKNDEIDKININVTHIRGIKTIAYRWNDEEETIINGENKTSITQTIDTLLGRNVLNITVTEENGQTRTLEKTFIVIIKLEAVENGIKLMAKCDDEIDFIQYAWDDGEIEKIEVGNTEYEGIINVPRGQHILKIEVVDEYGTITTKQKTVIGQLVDESGEPTEPENPEQPEEPTEPESPEQPEEPTEPENPEEPQYSEPTVTIKSKLINNRATFVIDAQDEEGIKTISIIHNGGQEQVINVNEKTYHREILMTEGEENTIIVTVTNEHDLTQRKGARFKNM